MTPEQQTIEKMARILEAQAWEKSDNGQQTSIAYGSRRKSSLRKSYKILSVIREIVLAEVRKKETYQNPYFYDTPNICERDRTVPEIEAALIEVLGGGK